MEHFPLTAKKQRKFSITMRRHKKLHLEPADNNTTKLVFVMRHRKFRSKFNKIMFWAAQYKCDRAMYYKYDNYGTNN